jgi:hypothetical protein
MKLEDLKNSRAKTGVSRLWLGVAAVAGAALAYLADPERGNARREAARRQLSGAAKAAAEGTSRWRKVISARLPGAPPQPPSQVTVPSEAPAATSARSRSKSAEPPAEAGADTKKPPPESRKIESI